MSNNNNSEIFTPDDKAKDIGKVDFETLKNLLPENAEIENESVKK